jgi:AcrR family transcriptional regulator
MGRPSLVAVRREELLDAVQQCIVERGVAGTTVALIAERADVQTSLVHHYLGSRTEMIAAAVTRAVANVERVVVEALDETTDPAQRLELQLTVLFDGQLVVPEINHLIDQLIVASYNDTAIRAAVQQMYRRFAAIMRATLRAAFPHATADECRRVAHGVLAIAHSSQSFEWLGFERRNLRFALAGARVLVNQLALASTYRSP